jgi:hypothetical protein
MRLARIAVLTLAVTAMAIEGKPQATVTEMPPEEIPTGTCSGLPSGYLGVVEKDKTERTKLTDQEIGQYVSKSLSQGYSVALYPQASGRIFVIATCHPNKP